MGTPTRVQNASHVLCLRVPQVSSKRSSRDSAISRTMALRKVSQPEDVARQVVVLASDELSGHVTGEVVTIAGGMEGRVVHE